MKKNLFLICLLAFATSVFAQDEEKSNIIFDGASYNFMFSWKKKPTKSHWTGPGFAFSNLDGLDKENVNLSLSRSYSVNLNLMDYNVPLHYNWLFFTGLGFDWSRYHFKGNIGLRDDSEGITRFLPDREGMSYRDSKLLVYYATIPLILEYQKKFGKNRTFFINGGVEGLICLYSKSQTETNTLNGIKKTSYKYLNIFPVNFRMVLRTGFDDFSIFGYYQPCQMFQKGKGPELRSWGIGISLH
ncbi:MAG: hypothetical protein LBH32_13145 [Dysgonamonadaceae bacterium]|jgi:hypothetical protein|nr:hypothetical protein [Dysgonamonadaceae bacterium]